jgi:hypothetical protein
VRLLTLLTIAFCLKPIQTNAVVTESIPNEVIWQFATYAYKVGLEDGRDYKIDIELKRLTIKDVEELL